MDRQKAKMNIGQRMEKSGNSAGQRTDLPPLPGPAARLLGSLYPMRRRIATGLVVLTALYFGFHAIFGQNGIDMFEQKRAQDHAIHQRILDLQQENAKLRQNIHQLRTSPDAIEHEARERLHYARPGEVIWTENAPPSASGK